jgi:GNAT superfamily N-acetyltransferase
LFYRRRVERNGSPPLIRSVRPDELTLLPDLEAAADTMFEPLGIGPLPGPGTVEEFAAALIVLVAGDPPVGLCRIDGIGPTGVAHLEQLSVHPDHAGRGIGRTLLRAGCGWAAEQGYREITLATYRDIPWNGPFYASEGFVERGPVDEFLRAHDLPPEEPVMSRFGVRVLMARRL